MFSISIRSFVALWFMKVVQLCHKHDRYGVSNLHAPNGRAVLSTGVIQCEFDTSQPVDI